MRVFLAGVAVVMALAGTGEAFRIEPPLPLVRMQFDRSLGGTDSVSVVVRGIEAPTRENLVLYPAGHPGTAAHPVWQRHSDFGPTSVVFVYRTQSPEVAAAMKQAVARAQLVEAIPGVEVTEIDDTDPDADATARAAAVLDKAKSRGLRRILVLIRDDCGGPQNAAMHSDRFVTVQLAAGCKRRGGCVQEFLYVPDVSQLGEVLPENLHHIIGSEWVASFDVRSLGVLETGDRALVLDIDGFVTEPVVVTFPPLPAQKPSPPWWDSRLRQIGLGALLVGLLALATRWRFNRRVTK